MTTRFGTAKDACSSSCMVKTAWTLLRQSELMWLLSASRSISWDEKRHALIRATVILTCKGNSLVDTKGCRRLRLPRHHSVLIPLRLLLVLPLRRGQQEVEVFLARKNPSCIGGSGEEADSNLLCEVAVTLCPGTSGPRGTVEVDEMLEGRGPAFAFVFGDMGPSRPSLSHSSDIRCSLKLFLSKYTAFEMKRQEHMTSLFRCARH